MQALCIAFIKRAAPLQTSHTWRAELANIWESSQPKTPTATWPQQALMHASIWHRSWLSLAHSLRLEVPQLKHHLVQSQYPILLYQQPSPGPSSEQHLVQSQSLCTSSHPRELTWRFPSSSSLWYQAWGTSLNTSRALSATPHRMGLYPARRNWSRSSC